MAKDAAPDDALQLTEAEPPGFPPADEYTIDGNAVERHTFEELRRALDVEAEPDMTGELVREERVALVASVVPDVFAQQA